MKSGSLVFIFVLLIYLCIISEPPDVRNWFSSYAYDSFVLDTNDDVKESVSDESESEKEAAKIVGVSRESKDSDEISAGECSGSKDKKSISKVKLY